MKLALLLLFVSITHAQQNTTPVVVVDPEPPMIKVIPVPMEKQIKHIRSLANFYFKKYQWKRSFSDNLCPEYTEMVIVDEVSYCTGQNKIVPPPLKPITVCEVNKRIEGCNFTERGEDPVELPEDLDQEIIGDGDVTPDCNENPRLCLPPTYCDIPANQLEGICEGVDFTTDCNVPANYDNVACIFINRCDMDEWKDAPGCEVVNPCRSSPELCLTICDREEFKDTKRCLIQRCEIFPDMAECEEVKECAIVTECLTPLDQLVNNECCPNAICNYVCIEGTGDVNCPPPPPEEECKWGYHLGQAVVDLLIEPIQKQDLDQNGVSAFLTCYNEYMTKTNKIVLKCFEGAVGAEFTAITESLEATIEKLKAEGDYDSVSVTLDEENQKEYSMTQERTNPGRA